MNNTITIIATKLYKVGNQYRIVETDELIYENHSTRIIITVQDNTFEFNMKNLNRTITNKEDNSFLLIKDIKEYNKNNTHKELIQFAIEQHKNSIYNLLALKQDMDKQ